MYHGENTTEVRIEQGHPSDFIHQVLGELENSREQVVLKEEVKMGGFNYKILKEIPFKLDDTQQLQQQDKNNNNKHKFIEVISTTMIMVE